MPFKDFCNYAMPIPYPQDTSTGCNNFIATTTCGGFEDLYSTKVFLQGSTGQWRGSINPFNSTYKAAMKLYLKDNKKENKDMEKSFVVTKVDVYNNRAVKLTFSDGTFTKAVCSDGDTFSLDVGITICMIKKMMGSSSAYNKAMKDIHKLMERNKKAEEKAREEEKARKLKREKILAKKKAKYDADREDYINALKEGYIRVAKELKNDA